MFQEDNRVRIYNNTKKKNTTQLDYPSKSIVV